jgi:hypothetical protein
MTISAKESVRKDLEDLFDKSEDRRRVWSAVVKAIEAAPKGQSPDVLPCPRG